MNTKIKLGLLFIIFLLASYLIYNFVGEKDNSNNIIEKFTKDEKEFKKEYESLNGKTSESTGNKYLDMAILEDNNVTYLNETQVIEMLESGTGIIYFGFKECPWCRNAVPVLVNTAYEYGVENIYYYNPSDIRNTLHLDEQGIIVTDKEGTNEYFRILELLGSNASVYEGLNNDSIKRLYVPTVVFVKEGQIVLTHTATVDSQTDPSVKLTDEQTDELSNIYADGINKVYEIICNEECD